MNNIFTLVGDVLNIELPQGHTMQEINELAKRELWTLTKDFYGKDIKINGRCTTALVLLMGHELSHICKSVSIFDPKENNYILVIKH